MDEVGLGFTSTTYGLSPSTISTPAYPRHPSTFVVFFAYFASLGNQFTSWDDTAYVTENVSIRSLD